MVTAMETSEKWRILRSLLSRKPQRWSEAGNTERPCLFQTQPTLEAVPLTHRDTVSFNRDAKRSFSYEAGRCNILGCMSSSSFRYWMTRDQRGTVGTLAVSTLKLQDGEQESMVDSCLRAGRAGCTDQERANVFPLVPGRDHNSLHIPNGTGGIQWHSGRGRNNTFALLEPLLLRVYI